MSSTIASRARATGAPAPKLPFSLAGRAVLLASDGSGPADAASRVAYALALQHHAVIHVVSVVDTRPAPLPPPLDLALALTDATVGQEVHGEQVAAARAGLQRVVGAEVDWPVRVTLGTPASVIVHEARRRRAALVIVGLRRHGRLDRAFQDETTLQVMRHAACPVLGVVDTMQGLPTRAMAALDFSQSSFAAARATRAVMPEGGTLVLAYSPPISFGLPDDGEATIHALGVAAGFAKCRAELDDGTLKLDQVVLHRAASVTTASTLLEYAEGARCELIAAGSARRGRVDRWLLGSVSTDLVREGRHSVLVVPPRPHRRPPMSAR